MSHPEDPVVCTACALQQVLIQELDKRVTALEIEVRGDPAEVLFNEFEAEATQREARQAAIEEYHRLEREAFYRKLPELKTAAEQQRAKYEAFMQARGFVP